VEGRIPVIAGTGANSTAEAIELTKNAKIAGANATLQVTPYYNKPTQEGLYAHFSTVADDAQLPVILYNVPGRSGVPIAIDTIQRLSSNTNIIAVKEAGGSTERVSAILDVCDITVLSGDDALTLPMLSVGATGVISVASNLIPEVMVSIVSEWFAGNPRKAMELHKAYYRFFKDCFIETNPLPIKAAMAVKGILEEEYRLPLCPMQESNLIALKDTMHYVGLI
jgi:4-hydroxy-tetrahydrodipicolinate synthase